MKFQQTFNEVSMIIPNEKAGRLIGRGGANISAMRENLETCNLLPPRDDGSGDRLLCITGSVMQITAALRSAISALMSPDDLA